MRASQSSCGKKIETELLEVTKGLRQIHQNSYAQEFIASCFRVPDSSPKKSEPDGDALMSGRTDNKEPEGKCDGSGVSA